MNRLIMPDPPGAPPLKWLYPPLLSTLCNFAYLKLRVVGIVDGVTASGSDTDIWPGGAGFWAREARQKFYFRAPPC